jgi:AraC-like DNA-binding protein
MQSVDVLHTPRPVAALIAEYPAGFVDPLHSHERAQLLYASQGLMSVVTPEGSYLVPPQRGLWLPSGAEHEVACHGAVSLRTLYIDAGQYPELPDRCCVLEVTDLLRSLILEAMRVEAEYDTSGRDGRVIRLIVDEIGRIGAEPLNVPMPRDPRLTRVCRAILLDPASSLDLDHWANIAGMGRRTFTRQFRRETGLSLAAWRQQVRLLEALTMLAEGKPITTVAFDVGYESPSAFTAMFHRVLGMAPSQYFERRAC